MAINEKVGDISIQNDVVATIGGIVMSEVEGVVSLAGKRFLDPLRTQKAPEKGIAVDIDGNMVRMSIKVKVIYGHNIYDTAHRLQQRVKNAIEQLTGLTVESIDVSVVDIVLDPRGKRAPEEESEEEGRN